MSGKKVEAKICGLVDEPPSYTYENTGKPSRGHQLWQHCWGVYTGFPIYRRDPSERLVRGTTRGYDRGNLICGVCHEPTALLSP